MVPNHTRYESDKNKTWQIENRGILLWIKPELAKQRDDHYQILYIIIVVSGDNKNIYDNNYSI